MVEKKVCHKIRESDSQTIRANIEKLKNDLRTLRNSKAASGSATKLAKIKLVRRNIARNLTILNQKERKTLSDKSHSGSVKRPIFLREKLTRAYRRQLTKHQRTKKIAKTQKKALNFPLRKYGLRA